MSGGTWTSQNKIRPGAYLNIKSKPKESVTLSDRGIVTLPLVLPWGPEKKVMEIDERDNLKDILGIDITDSSVLLIREVFKRAKTLLLYRLNLGTKATITLEGLSINAKYSGSKGNDIKIVIQNNIDDEKVFEVITIFENRQVDKQLVKQGTELKANNYVEFKCTGDMIVTAGINLLGGEDGEVSEKDYPEYLTKIEAYDFNTMGITSTNDKIKAIVTTFIKRLRNEGKKVQVVLSNYPIADDEGVISVKNGVILSDNTIITSVEAVAFIAGATAGANVNKSNTYKSYDGAVDVDIKYTNREVEEALLNGEIVFTINNRKVVIEQDINTLKSFSKEKGKEFRKNRVIRVLDSINKDIKILWNTKYNGDEDNDPDGRNLFRKDVIKYLEELQGINALQNVMPEDVVIEQGDEVDSVVAFVGVQPVDSMEKLYMNVEVQ